MKKPHLQLSESERIGLERLVAKGEMKVRELKRALALLALERGESLERVAAHQQVTNTTVAAWRDRFKREGLQGLHDHARSGRPVQIDGSQRAKVTALACREAPEGHGRWTLRLLAEKIVELDYCESISHTQVAQILKKTK
jgi:transposase